MKRFLLIIGVIISVIGIESLIINSNNANNSNYQTQRNNTDTNNVSTKTIEKDNYISNIQQSKPTEIEIASFSTKIHNKENARQNNIKITCNALTNTEIKSGEVFSFCNTVGKATEEKGYQEADIFVDGKKQKGFGGGNCQVSTTLYNAVANVDGIEIIERHEHSNDVPYIEKGKDAAVSYGSYDLKFKNNTPNTIKIIVEFDEENITAKIIKK
ncbi:MAG: hypothetical protein BHV99_00735 [Clostridium sp. 26_21]|nr:MAG: hypothetical protein BHV99_00735 [Clostridium sp. 26_21]